MEDPNYRPPELVLVGDDHVARYQETSGDVGYEWNGVSTLLLTTTGRRTNQLRTSALIFARDTDDYLVVASTGGAPKHPSWYLNLETNPKAQIQVKNEHVLVVARTASIGERTRLWQIVTENWPNYDVYQTRTERIIPIVVLTPA